MKTLKSNLFWLSLLLLLLGSTSCKTKKAVVTSNLPKKTVIVAVNDMHAAIDNFPRFAFMVDSLRELYPELLLVSGGDNQTGNPVNDQYIPKGLPMIELMNELKFDLSAVGNHEFDSRLEGFKALTHKANFPFICANVIPPADLGIKLQPYLRKTMPNGMKFFFLSVLDINKRGIPDTHPDNVKGYKFMAPLEAVDKYLPEVKSDEILVFVNHFGFENDIRLANHLQPGVSPLIIGGHSHTKVDKEQVHNGTLITQAERKLAYITLIELTQNPNGSIDKKMKLITINKDGACDPKIQKMVDVYNDNPKLRQFIAKAEDEFSSYEMVGYLMVDAIRSEAGSDFAFSNPGGVRIDKLAKGDITTLDVYSMDPFGNEIILFNLSGPELVALISAAYEMDDRVPLIPSGLKSEFYVNKDGSLKEVKLFNLDGTPLDMNRNYTVAMNNYMASIYKYDHKDPGKGLFRPTAESIIEYIKKRKSIPSYKNESRIKVISVE